MVIRPNRGSIAQRILLYIPATRSRATLNFKWKKILFKALKFNQKIPNIHTIITSIHRTQSVFNAIHSVFEPKRAQWTWASFCTQFFAWLAHSTGTPNNWTTPHKGTETCSFHWHLQLSQLNHTKFQLTSIFYLFPDQMHTALAGRSLFIGDFGAGERRKVVCARQTDARLGDGRFSFIANRMPCWKLQ